MASAILLSERPEEDLQIFNRGVGGDRIVNLYARMAVDGYVLQPELMSVLVGVNDTCLDGQRPNGVPLGAPCLPCLPCLPCQMLLHKAPAAVHCR